MAVSYILCPLTSTSFPASPSLPPHSLIPPLSPAILGFDYSQRIGKQRAKLDRRTDAAKIFVGRRRPTLNSKWPAQKQASIVDF